MWLKRFIPHPNEILVAGALVTLLSVAVAAVNPDHVGPRSDEEAGVLAQEGKEAFDTGRFADAVTRLRRLVERYPAVPGNLEAQRMLGIANLEIGHPKDALKPLRNYTESRGKTSDGMDGRILLGRAYLDLGKFHEAYLTAIELLNRHEKEPLSPAQQLAALLVKSNAQAGLKRAKDASATLASARKEIPATEVTPLLLTELGEAELRLKLKDCSRFPSRGPLTEAQARQQLQRRGDCLTDAARSLEGIFQNGADSKWSTKAAERVADAYRAYDFACLNPPKPPGKRSALQLKRYREELVQVLSKDCTEKRALAVAALGAVEERLPSQARSRLQQVARDIGK